MKKAAVFFVLAMMVLAACSTKQKIVGTWIADEGDLLIIFSADGKVTLNGRRGTYTTTGTQLSISVDGETQVGDFSLSSDGNTLLVDEGDSLTLTKCPRPVSLREKRWVDGIITPNARGIAYSFNAVRGKTYFIWTNDGSDGDGSKSLDIEFSVFDENDGYDDGDDCWSGPYEFTASDKGRITIVVSAYDEDESGTFAIAYSTSPARP
jgi:hypothetical protein